MSVLKKLSQMFSGSGANEQGSGEAVSEAKPQASQGAFAEEPPVRRRVIQAPVVMAEAEESGLSDQILIKAEPSRDYEQCKFMVNRSLFEGHSWLFSSFEEAAGSPIAESVFSVESVASLLIHESTAVVTKTGAKGVSDWKLWPGK